MTLMSKYKERCICRVSSSLLKLNSQICHLLMSMAVMRVHRGQQLTEVGLLRTQSGWLSLSGNCFLRFHIFVDCLDNQAPIWLLFSIPCHNLAPASNNARTPPLRRTDCSLNKWNFLFCGGTHSCCLMFCGPQLNMAVIIFFLSWSVSESRGSPGKPSIISGMLGIWNDAVLGRKLFMWIILLLFSGLKRGLSQSQHYTLVSTMLFFCWQLDTSLTRRSSSAKWVSGPWFLWSVS